MTGAEVVIVGAGVAGLLSALELCGRGFRCSIFDASTEQSPGCSPQGGGMLAPLSELDHADPEITALGLDAPARWNAILGSATRGALWDQPGSLLLAHRPEWPLLTQLQQRAVAAGLGERVHEVDASAIAELEPWTAGRIRRGLWIPSEGVVHPRAVLPALRERLRAAGATIHTGVRVDGIGPRKIVVQGTTHEADVVVDCRGLGARPDQPLRGVRGEFAMVRPATPSLRRPVRLMHPRYPLYVIPRPDGQIYVGATQLEREDDGPAEVRSALELLSALYSLDPALADASIESIGVGLRPAYADNLPRLRVAPGLVTLNGLFRHGYLLAPVLSAWVGDAVEGRAPPSSAAPYWTREA